MNRKQLAKISFVAVFCLLVQACSAVYMTSALEDTVQQTGMHTCRGNSGAYFLPKAELQFSVQKTGKAGDASFRYEMKSGIGGTADGPTTVLVADARQEHCLDFLANALYSDVVRVKRSNGLLESVYSNVKDQSKEAIGKAADGIATAVAARARSINRDFDGAAANTIDLMQMQFDPFDAHLLTQVNDALRPTGHCIYMDPTNDPYVPFWMQHQCSTVKTYRPYNSKGDPEEVFDTANFSAGEGRFGILYKPLLTHTLVIMKRDDPTSAKPWRVWQRQIVHMPNRAPVFMVQVSRGLLTTRKTAISFKQGMLASVQIDKESELKAVSEVFVKIVEVAVQIPAKALILRKTEAENQADLIRINQALLLAYSDLKETQEAQANLNNGFNEDGTPRSDLARSALRSTALGNCIRYAELSNVDDPGLYCQTQAAQE